MSSNVLRHTQYQGSHQDLIRGEDGAPQYVKSAINLNNNYMLDQSQSGYNRESLEYAQR